MKGRSSAHISHPQTYVSIHLVSIYGYYLVSVKHEAYRELVKRALFESDGAVVDIDQEISIARADASGSVSGGDCLTEKWKRPQWQAPSYVAEGFGGVAASDAMLGAWRRLVLSL
jgi:hypothetical protein